MKLASELKRMGFSDDLIARAKVDGKPLDEVDKPKPSRDGMNKTEALYATELDWRMQQGEILFWSFGAVKLRLAKKTWYTPDFMVGMPDGRIIFVEIKGFLRDDAGIKFKVARETYPWAEWVMYRRIRSSWVPVNI